MISVKDIIKGLISSQDYFKSAVFADDVNQYAIMVDNLPELPAIGVFFTNQMRSDWQGVIVADVELTFFHACDMLNTDAVSDIDTMNDFINAVHDFLTQLKPYVQSIPNTGETFRDSVLSGTTYSLAFINTPQCMQIFNIK